MYKVRFYNGRMQNMTLGQCFMTKSNVHITVKQHLCEQSERTLLYDVYYSNDVIADFTKKKKKRKKKKKDFSTFICGPLQP